MAVASRQEIDERGRRSAGLQEVVDKEAASFTIRRAWAMKPGE
jgi:hypothetical protein